MPNLIKAHVKGPKCGQFLSFNWRSVYSISIKLTCLHLRTKEAASTSMVAQY